MYVVKKNRAFYSTSIEIDPLQAMSTAPSSDRRGESTGDPVEASGLDKSQAQDQPNASQSDVPHLLGQDGSGQRHLLGEGGSGQRRLLGEGGSGQQKK